ncbi:hypothetical protein [Labilithrix luteola]|uniref:hypothetical protein n=1 Tax=Labilithrix luteola TaxID=1391654 RepID=UPI0011BAC091|nr:hypothetical protein [Labilithrix luteola]
MFGAFACGPPGPRDVVPEPQTPRADADAGAAPSNDVTAGSEGYAYVARLPHGAIGLVGTKQLRLEEASALVDRLAGELEACAARKEAQGTLSQGAASLVVVANANGTAAVSDLKLAPGGPVAADALECLVAPARAMAFPVTTSTALRALAIEATWNPIGHARSATDAGRPQLDH